MNKATLFLAFVLCINSLSARAQQHEFAWANIDTAIQRAMATFGTTGLSVAIVHEGQVIFAKAYGLSDVEAGEPLTTKSLFNIASCTKAFTAAAMALLVAEGKVHWDDKVVDWLPQFRLADEWITHQLTLRDLLCHRSGLATFMGDLLWYHTDYSDEEVMRRMRWLPIERGFRSEYGYQNNMYMIAGLVIAKASGMNWEQFIQQRLLRPLDMTHTRTSNDSLRLNDPLAWPHINGQRIELYDFHATKPAGSLFANVEDLTHWVQMWLDNGQWADSTILPPAQIDVLTQAHLPLPLTQLDKQLGTHFKAYALGWRLFDYNGQKVIEHDGGMPGYISKITIVPEAQLGIILLNNDMDFFINSALRYHLLDWMQKGQPSKDFISRYHQFKKNYLHQQQQQRQQRLDSRIPNTQPSLPHDAWAGVYEDQWYGKALVSVNKGGALTLTLVPAKEVFRGPLTHWHFNTYRVDFKDPFLPFGLVTFELNAQGQPTGFTIDLPSNDFHFDKLHFRKVSQ